MTTNYGYGTGNDLLTTLSVGGTTTQTITYTGDGNMANFTPGILAPGGAMITALGWNQNERLSAVKSGSSVLARYDYDGFCVANSRFRKKTGTSRISRRVQRPSQPRDVGTYSYVRPEAKRRAVEALDAIGSQPVQ